MFPKNESPDGFAGKYIPVPLEYANPAGRAHTFANAQNQQTASSVISYFVYAIQDYQLVTITNLLMEQTLLGPLLSNEWMKTGQKRWTLKPPTPWKIKGIKNLDLRNA